MGNRGNKNVDKNLRNVVKDLDQIKVNSYHAKQIQQDTNDRRHQDALNHEE
jgi:hypothetical protein